MKIIMDSDCLVKLTKSGAKEMITEAMEVIIPPLVVKETVKEGKNFGYQDARMIEENIHRGTLHVIKAGRRTPIKIPVAKGERDVLSLYLSGRYDAIASDDRRFLKKLDSVDIPYLTPATCIVYLFRSGKVDKSKVVELLNALFPYINSEEYRIAIFSLEVKP
ncbi:MAG: hypothetical protein A2Y48_07895 [Nitrospirae bacterium RIFCSPLOW2_12_42_9]|nr:MAG: hypothetical protein A2Y48_07895 [Nitrospirae bacterium RIFCSPLOW2_12_42_9]OGW76553.1 MAG: hypothetical protein A3J72_01105 [Nitrospirae bacterium RIFCSPHIGHO2_02_FULL_40_19]